MNISANQNSTLAYLGFGIINGGTEIKKDTVIVKGIVHKQVFLVDEGDLVRHAFEDIPFSKSIKIEGARPENDVFVRVRVTLDDFEVIKPPSKDCILPRQVRLANPCLL
jgi:hypothetical protein